MYLETSEWFKLFFPNNISHERYAEKGPRSIRPLVAEINLLKLTNELQIFEKMLNP